MEPLAAQTYRIDSVVYRRNVPVDRLTYGQHIQSRPVVGQLEEDEDACDETAVAAAPAIEESLQPCCLLYVDLLLQWLTHLIQKKKQRQRITLCRPLIKYLETRRKVHGLQGLHIAVCYLAII